MKKKLPPAAAHFTVSKICEYLEEDPEVVDYYLFRFFETWGEKAMMAMFRFVLWCYQNDKEAWIKPTLLHDFGLKKGNATCPRTSGY